MKKQRVNKPKSKWDSKVTLLGTILEALEKYPVIVIVETSQANSTLINNIRAKLHSQDQRNTLILGKRSIFLMAIQQSSLKNKSLLSIKPYMMTGICGLLFSFSDPQTLCSIIKSECKWEGVSHGMSCPVDIYMPKGPLPLEPTETSFFSSFKYSHKNF